MQLLKNDFVKRYAAEIGLDICRVTDGKELKKQRKILKKRAKSEFWPQPFTNQDIDQLTRPKLHLDSLKSIIVVAQSYNNNGNSSHISNYITIKDYHHFLKEKMKKLVEHLKTKLTVNFNYKIFVDTAPFLERALAQKAGVGFIGKNSMLINPKYGSYLFLGEIFTDLNLEKDEELKRDCGSCSICLDNCEGGALKDEYLLDAEDCISYLTQKKGILPIQENQKIGSHIWGCDVCQSKCPYNKQQPKTNEKEMQFLDLDLEYFLNLERKSMPSKLKKTAISWRGSRILLRNALIVAANNKEKKYYNLIEKKLSDKSPIIRYYAASALIKINFKKSKKTIIKFIKKENNKEIKNKIKRIFKVKEELHES